MNSDQGSPEKPPPRPIEKAPDSDVIAKPIARPVEIAVAQPMDRRTFLKLLTVGWAAFIAVLAGYGTLLLRYLFPNVLFEPKQTFSAGRISDYTVGEVSERFKKQHGVWVVRDSDKLYALIAVCTHLGCTPNWLSNENKFKCPCHGSGYYKSGINFEGPTPRPLERAKIYLSPEGEIIVDKTAKYQYEKGQWSDSNSFIPT